MKTWEMIKELTENPKLKFVCEKQPHNQVGIIGDTLCWLNGVPMGFNFESFAKVGTIDRYDWELVREPVDFMTAVNSGNDIRYEDWETFNTVSEALYILSDKILSTAQMMINGKWYIE